MILAFETARQLGLRAIFAEEVRAPDGAIRREFRRGFTIEPGERVLLVDDILTTGGSLLAMIPAVEALGGEIVACHVLVDRSGGMASLTSPRTGRVYPLAALWVLDLPTYEAGSGDLSALRRRDPPPRAGQHRHGDLMQLATLNVGRLLAPLDSPASPASSPSSSRSTAWPTRARASSGG